MDTGAWQTSVHGIAESQDMTEVTEHIHTKIYVCVYHNEILLSHIERLKSCHL